MKVLISGASGFIGRRLAERLAKKEHEVTGIYCNNKISIPNVKLVQADLTSSDFSLPDEKYDIVFHLAAQPPLEKNKKKYIKANYEGTVNLFERIKDKTKFLVYISGLGVFGDVGGTVIDENTKPNPNTDYAKVRLEAQQFLEKSCNENSISFTVVYLGEVYGNGGWFGSLIVPRIKNGSFRLPSGGEYFRAVVHVDDVVSALVSIAEKNAQDQTFVISDSEPVLFKDFINFTADQLGAKHPGRVPTFLAKAVLGGDAVKLLTTSIKVSNKKISSLCSFEYPSYREGIRAIVSEMK